MFSTPIRIAALLLFVAACSTQGQSQSPREVDESTVFSIDEKETVRLRQSGRLLTFEARVGDSRCPVNNTIQCVWEGRVTLELSITSTPDESTRSTFVTEQYIGPTGTTPAVLDTLGFKWSLQRLDPFPTGEPIPDDPARLTLMLTPIVLPAGDR